MPELRLALLCDYPEEDWPSMELCGEMLRRELERAQVPVRALRPEFRRRASGLPGLSGARGAFNLDRLLNRHWDYLRFLQRELRRDPHPDERFHVVDHSYAQLVHVLPRGRVGVFCHDLDTFRCLLEPERDPRPRWFRRMARHSLSGFQRADLVFHTTRAVRAEIERLQVVDPARLVQAPLGVSWEFRPEAPDAPPAFPELRGRRYLLQVAGCTPRKRVDLSLALLAALRGRHPDLRFVRVGGPWGEPEHARIAELGLEEAVEQRSHLTRAELAELYRGALALVVPSEDEGFGIPVIEALACGAPVVASDLPALREVGGDAAVFCPRGELEAWVERLDALLAKREPGPTRDERLAQAARFSWKAHAEAVLAGYRRLADA